MPIRYRQVGEATWLNGIIENINHSGVLFRAVALLDVGTNIEIAITLSVATRVSPASDAICRARIVRADRRFSAPYALLAAEFSEYRFVQAQGRS